MAPSRFLLVCLLAAQSTLASLLAQGPGRQPFAVLGVEQGLPASAVLSLAQDRDGFIWMGTENGLVRYEGDRCRRWAQEDGLPSAYIPVVLPDPEKGVWVGTLRGLGRLRDGRFEPAMLGEKAWRSVSSILAQGRDGRIWVAAARTLYVQQDGLRFEPSPWQPGSNILGLSVGSRTRNVYVSVEDGIHVLRPDGTARHLGAGEGLPSGVPRQVAEDGEGRLWVGSGRTLGMLPREGTRFTDQSRHLPGNLSPNGTPSLDSDGSVWLPTRNGVLHLIKGRAETIMSSSGLPFRWVRSTFRDREGILWIMGPSLARHLGRGRVQNFSLTPGISGEVVWFITRDAAGHLLVGTDDGAARMGPSGLVRIPGTEGRRIKSLAMDGEGTLWMVNTTGPTLWLPAGQQRAVIAPLGDLGLRINTVKKDSTGRVWLGSTLHGVLRWDPREKRLIQEVPPGFAGIPSLGAYSVGEDAQGRLWVGSTAGLLLRQPDGRWLRFTEKDGLAPYTLLGQAFLPDGSAWLHYQEPHRLSRVRVDGDRLTVFEPAGGGIGLRPDLFFYAVQVDDQGHTWVTSDQGLDRLEPPLHVGRQDGMVSEDCSLLSLLADGRTLWVGTAGGLVRYDSEGAGTVAAPPRAHLLQASHGTTRLEPPFGVLDPVPSREATLDFRIAAPSYSHTLPLRFQVRLVGLEEAWREAEGRIIRYPALPGGHYRFEVRAAFGPGAFGPVDGLDFTVRPPWWKTWWAMLLAGLTILGLIGATFRMRLAALARRQAELEALVAHRTEELQLRNVELTEALGNVKQLSGLLPICASCKKIRDDSGYWNRLEVYISERSEADFTHGICPDCAAHLYPETVKKHLESSEPPSG